MVEFFQWLFINFSLIIGELTNETVYMISGIFDNFMMGDDTLQGMTFNLTLFSDIPILSTTVFDFLVLFFGVFYTVIFIVIVWKIIKKVVVKITGWNKW